MKERRGKTVIRLTGNQVVGYQESGYQEEDGKGISNIEQGMSNYEGKD